MPRNIPIQPDHAAATNAFIRTIVYSDLFSFPMTKEELWKYLKTDRKLPREEFESALHHLPSAIKTYSGMYFLSGKKHLIHTRKTREKPSKQKMKLARYAASVLAWIPFIRFIGISGSLASGSADAEDDIDFFIITEQHTMWICRILALLLLSIMGIRRGKNIRDARDTICINMILENNRLRLPPDRRDIYTAHEISQLVPLINKKNTYQTFVSVNKWISAFMPNSLDSIAFSYSDDIPEKNYLLSFLIARLLLPIIRIVDLLAKKIQLWKINKSKTTETVTDSLLAFHPEDPREKLLKAYRKRLKMLAVQPL